MKFIKKLIIGLLILFILVVVVSVETDFFTNIEEYMPKATGNFPQIVEVVDKIEEMTEIIPSFSQIKAAIKNEPLPVDPDDLAKGTYNSKSPMLNFYSGESIGVLVNDGTEISVFGITSEKEKSNILIVLTDEKGKEITRATAAVNSLSFEFKKDIKIPKTDASVIGVNVYAGEKSYGEFESWVMDYIKIERVNDRWELKKSAVRDHNKSLYEAGKSLSEALKKTEAIRPENASIKSVANQLTQGIDNDYDKLLAIHNWVCNYLYYNIDYVNDSKIAPYIDTEVLKNRKVVCLGYSNLFASLCRSIGIPCYVVSGYALGIDSNEKVWTESNMKEEANHAWNEAYVNGRWIIIDTTWDSFNSFEDGKMIKAEKNSYLYFDANPEFFSANHKIIQYLTN